MKTLATVVSSLVFWMAAAQPAIQTHITQNGQILELSLPASELTRPWVLEESTNLLQWQRLFTNAPGLANDFQITSLDTPNRWYRWRSYAEAVVCNPNMSFFSGYAATPGGKVTFRKRIQFTADCEDICIHYAADLIKFGRLNPYAWSCMAGLQRTDDAGDPAGDVLPFTFNGSITNAMTFGVTKSDPIPVRFKKGEIAYVLTMVLSDTFPQNTYLTLDSGDNLCFGNGITSPALLINSTSRAGDAAVGPSLITGTVAPSAKEEAVGICGDSISQFYNDSRLGMSFGWFGRAVGGTRGCVTLAIGGSTAESTAGQPISSDIYYPAQYFSVLVYNLGFNDLGHSNTAAIVQTAVTNIVKYFRELGVQKVIGLTVLPIVASTDGCLTTAGQTPDIPTKEWQAYNQWIKSSNGVFDTSWDFSATLADEANPTLRATGPTTVIATDIAGPLSNLSALRTSGTGVRSPDWVGATIQWNHGGTNFIAQTCSFRPGLPNIIFLTGIDSSFQALSPGDPYTIYNSWDGDTAGGQAHPNGYGHARAASQFPLTLLDLP